jgi:hypothetical protein
MKRGTHQVAIAGASASDVAVHSASNRVVFDQASIGSRFGLRDVFGYIR